MRSLSNDLDVGLDDASVPSLIRFGFIETSIQGFSANVALTPYGELIIEAIKRIDRDD